MHAVENVDVYVILSIDIATRGKHGKARGRLQPDSTQSSGGLEVNRGERYIAVVLFNPACESRITRSITFKPKPALLRGAQAFFFSRGSHPLLMSSQYGNQVEHNVRYVSLIQQFDSQISWEYSS